MLTGILEITTGSEPSVSLIVISSTPSDTLNHNKS
jgi:hypothetical protein